MDELWYMIKGKALRISDGELFELASGGRSNYFFDMKPVSLDPKGSNLIARCILDRITEYEDVNYIGGIESGSIPIVTAVCVVSLEEYRPLQGFYVRKEPKRRGTKNFIEGNLREGEKVIVLEDVITEGRSSIRAIEAIRNFGCEVVKVISVVDREAGARENLKAVGVDFESLFTKSDFGL